MVATLAVLAVFALYTTVISSLVDMSSLRMPFRKTLYVSSNSSDLNSPNSTKTTTSHSLSEPGVRALLTDNTSQPEQGQNSSVKTQPKQPPTHKSVPKKITTNCKCSKKNYYGAKQTEDQFKLVVPWLNETTRDVLKSRHPNLAVDFYFKAIGGKVCDLLPTQFR